MDPGSVVNSVIAFVQIADRVIRACKHCIDAVKDAPKEMQMILGETISLRAIIESLNSIDLHANTVHLVPSLFAPLGPVEACRRCLSQLEGMIPQEQPQKALQGKRKITLVELAWPLKESKARRLMAEISQHKATLLLAMTGDMMHDIKQIKSSVQRVEDTLTGTQRQEIIQWVESTNPSPLHNAAFRKHERHTCTWILQTPEWKSWINSTQSARLLWIHGIPGAGKTVLASFIIEQLREIYGNNTEVGQAYYYCHFSHNKDEAVPFLRWVVGKLCRQAKWIPDTLKTIHDHGCDPTIPELENALEAICTRFGTVYLTIDAMDESNPRSDLLTVIETIASDRRFPNVRILATSRLYLDIERSLASKSIMLSMSNLLVERDIREFVRAKLASSRLMKRWSHIWGEIEDTLVAGARGMFRWAECQMHAIERLRDETQIRSALCNLPQDLADTYARILENIPDSDRQFVTRVLIWVIGHAEAPWMTDLGLNARVLLSAVRFDLGEVQNISGSHSDEVDYLREICGCLLTFNDNPEEDASTMQSMLEFAPGEGECIDRHYTESLEPESFHSAEDVFVSLSHYTVLEFLQSPHIFRTRVSYFSLTTETMESEFITSVLQQAVRADPRKTESDWVRDSEAYCLVLACAFPYRFSPSRPNMQELFVQYFDPTRPHYHRIIAIQKRIFLGKNRLSRAFYVNRLPIQVSEISGSGEPAGQAATFFNMLLVADDELVETVNSDWEMVQMLSTRLSATWIDEDEASSASILRTETLEGTMMELLTQRLVGSPIKIYTAS